MSEELNNQEHAIETPIVEETPAVEPVLVQEPVVEQTPVIEPALVQEPVVETKVEEVAKDFGVEASVAEVVEPAQDVITTPSYSGGEGSPALGFVGNGAIGSVRTEVPKKAAPKKPAKKADEETVAIYSERNMTWSGVGKVNRGYNIVPKSTVDQWLTKSTIRLATPEEVKKAYGK